VEIMGGGDALGEPALLGGDVAGAEELRVVAEGADQLGIAMPQDLSASMSGWSGG
jgi:hypothetical protein